MGARIGLQGWGWGWGLMDVPFSWLCDPKESNLDVSFTCISSFSGLEEKMTKISALPLVVGHFSQSQQGSSKCPEPSEADEDSSSCSDIQDTAPSSPESDSCNR